MSSRKVSTTYLAKKSNWVWFHRHTPYMDTVVGSAKEEQDQDRAYAPVRADVFLRLSVAESENRIQYDSIYSMSTLMGVASAQ